MPDTPEQHQEIAMAANIPPPTPMKLSGNLSVNWDIFRAEYEDYALATGLVSKPKEVQAATLRSIMGAECRHVYKHNLTLTDAQRADASVILNSLEQYFTPAKNVIYERYIFGCCKQEEGEAIDCFVTRLREKAATCDYGALRDELIRDKIVIGIANESTRRRLLREKDLTLASAIEACRAAELSDLQLRSMEQERSHMDSVNAIGKPPFKRQFSTAEKMSAHPRSQAQSPSTCKYCGTSHGWGKEHCPAYGKNCNSCGTANHFARVCNKTKRKEGKLHIAEGLNFDKESTVIETNDVYAVESIGAVRTRGKKWFVNLRLNGTLQKCQIDSGATCNVMSLRDKKRLAPREKLKQSNTTLKLYSDHGLPSLGVSTMDCVVRGCKYKLEFEVVNARQLPLLSGSMSEEMGLIHFTIPEELRVEELNTVNHSLTKPLSRNTVITAYQDVFTGPVEALPGEVHFELDPAIQPVQCAPRNVPVAMKDAVKAQLDRYEAEGHITSVSEPTDWISNMVIVRRPEKLRICLQPHHLNRALKRSHYIMPTLEDVLYKLPKAKVFTLVDARDAFLQCKLDEVSSFMTTFWTPWGRKRWLKLPFGVTVAPEVYQRRQHELLAGLEGVEPIADDILVVGCGDSDEEAGRDHDAKLIALLDRCRQVKLRLSVRKLQFKVSEVRFHGHILSAVGLKADPEKVRAVLDMPAPTDVKSVQRLIGFVTYLAKFLPQLSEVCEPLRRLTDKDTVWHWLPKHDSAVKEIKRLVTMTPVLRYYDVTKPVTVQSDSSQHGLGCCLMQEGQPIAFASRALTPTEQNYAQIEKECLSIVFACQRFHHYLYGRDTITAETDHKPLIPIFSKPLLNAPKRLQSMLLALQSYNLQVIYKPGPEMFVSDTLSRAVAPSSHPSSMHAEHTVCSMVDEQRAIEHINMADYINVTDKRLLQIQQHTDNDAQLQAVKAIILNGWPAVKDETEQAVREYWPIKEELSVQNGVLFRGQRVVIPKSLRAEMLARVHCSHIGGDACYRQARETLYWPGMQGDIKDFVSKCTTCNEYAVEQQKETMLSHELPTRPWQIVSLDLFQHSGKDFLMLVDHYSDYWEIDVLPDLSAETTIKRCKAQFARYGQPDRVITDNGPQFACTHFRQFSVEWEFEHVTSSPRHPKANGKAEAAVKIAKNLCKKALREGKDAWKAILQWRNTPTEGMDSSPAQRLMARRLKSALPVAPALLEPRVIMDVVDKLRHRKQVSKLIYDRTAKDLPELSVGEAVRMKPLPGDRTGIWRRGVCLRKVAPRSYLVEVEGALYRRNRVDLRMAEPMPSQHLVTGPEEPASGGDGVQAPGEMTEGQRACMFSPQSAQGRFPSSPCASGSLQTSETAAVPSPSSSTHSLALSRYGRQIRPPSRLNL